MQLNFKIGPTLPISIGVGGTDYMRMVLHAVLFLVPLQFQFHITETTLNKVKSSRVHNLYLLGRMKLDPTEVDLFNLLAYG